MLCGSVNYYFFHTHQTHLCQVPGSATFVVASLQHSTAVLDVANVGDSGIRVVRKGAVVLATTQKQHQFEMPYQLACTAFADVKDQFDSAADAECLSFTVQVLARPPLHAFYQTNKSTEPIDESNKQANRSIKQTNKVTNKLLIQTNRSIKQLVQNKKSFIQTNLTSERRCVPSPAEGVWGIPRRGV